MSVLDLGSTLPNGAIVLDSNETVVLAMNKAAVQPFVTWSWYESENDIVCESGDYFCHLENAVKGYKKRIGE